MKIKISLLCWLFVLGSALSARMIVAWEFAQSGNPLLAEKGDFNLVNAGAVTFSASNGADFIGSGEMGQLVLAYDPVLEPGSIAAGEAWRLSLGGVRFDSISGTQAIYSSRDALGQATIIYLDEGHIAFWTGDGMGGWNKLVGPPAMTGLTYGLVAKWDGRTMSLSVDDGSGKSTWELDPLTIGFNSGLSGDRSAIRFGMGGDRGTQYAFNGQLQNAKIVRIPEFASSGILIGLVCLGAGVCRRRYR